MKLYIGSQAIDTVQTLNETEPQFNASVASNITQNDIDTWNSKSDKDIKMLTQAEYDALSTDLKNDGTIYMISDAGGYTKAEVDALLENIDLSNYATKDEIPSLDGYALTSDIPDVSSFITSSDLPDTSNFATNDDVSNAMSKADEAYSLADSAQTTANTAQSTADSAVQTANDAWSAADSAQTIAQSISVPTSLSELSNDCDFITSSDLPDTSSFITSSDLPDTSDMATMTWVNEQGFGTGSGGVNVFCSFETKPNYFNLYIYKDNVQVSEWQTLPDDWTYQIDWVDRNGTMTKNYKTGNCNQNSGKNLSVYYVKDENNDLSSVQFRIIIKIGSTTYVNVMYSPSISYKIPSIYYTKSEVDSKIPDTSSFITASSLPDTSNFATKDEIPDTSSFITSSDLSSYAKTTDIQVAKTPTKNKYVGTITDCDSEFYSDEAEYISNMENLSWCDGTGGNYEIDNTEHQYTYNGETYKYKVSYSGTFGDEYTFTFYFEVPNFDTFEVNFLENPLKSRSSITQVAGESGTMTWKEYVDGKIPDTSSFITSSDLPDTSQFITSSDLPDTSQFITSSDLPDTSSMLTKTELESDYVKRQQLGLSDVYDTVLQSPQVSCTDFTISLEAGHGNMLEYWVGTQNWGSGDDSTFGGYLLNVDNNGVCDDISTLRFDGISNYDLKVDDGALTFNNKAVATQEWVNTQLGNIETLLAGI